MFSPSVKLHTELIPKYEAERSLLFSSYALRQTHWQSGKGRRVLIWLNLWQEKSDKMLFELWQNISA
jgi:hypothetical protein